MSKIFDWAATDRDFPPIAGRGRGYPITPPKLGVDEALEVRDAIRQLPERKPMPVSGQLPKPITGTVKERFVFTMARRKTLTNVSDFVVPAGHPILVDGQTQYPTEPYRIAVEPDGEGVYPILESIFAETYEIV
jgi:hypothetical protein